MKRNAYLPNGLPLMHDGSLVRLLVNYRHAYGLIKRSAASYTETMRAQVEEALNAIENELCARGLRHYLALEPCR